jgi:hypothetical protein
MPRGKKPCMKQEGSNAHTGFLTYSLMLNLEALIILQNFCLFSADYKLELFKVTVLKNKIKKSTPMIK